VKRSIWIGWDEREHDACHIAIGSIRRRLTSDIPVDFLVADLLVAEGLYRRPTERREGRLWDVISAAPMVKELAGSGWALFMDGDVLVRADLTELFDGLDPSRAIYCVHHRHDPPAGLKMDGQLQLGYARKNWSSVMAVNCDHPANDGLTVDLVNTVPGRELHRFCWIDDGDLIGALDPKWNWLAPPFDPAIVHFTEGVPDMPGYEHSPFAEEWRTERARSGL
jgi:hypothetical protein